MLRWTRVFLTLMLTVPASQFDAFAQTKQSRIDLSSPAFRSGERIPKKFTGDGEDASPPLLIQNVPSAARELVIIVDDPDAPAPAPWVHWLLYGVQPSLRELPERLPPVADLSSPVQARQGKNSWGTTGYRGPHPPKGKEHRYYFRIYALDAPLHLPAGLGKEQLLSAMKGRIVGQGELMTEYRR